MWESGIGRHCKTRTAARKTTSRRKASRGTWSRALPSWGGHPLEDARRKRGVGLDAFELDRVCIGDQGRPEPKRISHQPRRRAGALPDRLLELDADDPAAGAAQGPGFDLAAVRLAVIATVQPS